MKIRDIVTWPLGYCEDHILPRTRHADQTILRGKRPTRRAIRRRVSEQMRTMKYLMAST